MLFMKIIIHLKLKKQIVLKFIQLIFMGPDLKVVTVIDIYLYIVKHYLYMTRIFQTVRCFKVYHSRMRNFKSRENFVFFCSKCCLTLSDGTILLPGQSKLRGSYSFIFYV